jgi:hypothetical protein
MMLWKRQKSQEERAYTSIFLRGDIWPARKREVTCELWKGGKLLEGKEGHVPNISSRNLKYFIKSALNCTNSAKQFRRLYANFLAALSLKFSYHHVQKENFGNIIKQ